MKILNFILLLFVAFTFVSCDKDDNKEETQELTINHGSESFKLNYTIDNGVFNLVSDYPAGLKDLQSNNDLVITLQDDELYLVDKSQIKSEDNTRTWGKKVEDIDRNEAFYERFGLTTVNHFGFVDADMDAAMTKYADRYDIPIYYEPQLKKREYYDANGTYDYNVDLIFGAVGKDLVELIQTIPGDNLFGNFITETGGGLHHLGFSMDDVDAVEKQFNDAGYPTLINGTFESNLGLVANLKFIDTRATTGYYTEIVNNKLLGFNVEQNEALLIFGLFLGDVKLKKVP